MVIRVLALLVVAAVAGAAGLLIVSTASATQHPERSFSPASVGPGTDREVVVTITRVGALDGFAEVVETLPAGFSFKEGSEMIADSSPHEKAGAGAAAVGQVVTIQVLVADSVSYTVEVADDVASDSYEFRGTLKKFTGDITIDASRIMVTTGTGTPPVDPDPVDPDPVDPDPVDPDPVDPGVTPPDEAGPRRSFSPATLAAGMNREVVVTVSGIDALSGFAQVIETLPSGFTFKTGSEEVADANPHARSGASATFVGQVLTIEVLAADSIRYTVMVDDSVAAGSPYEFSGVVKKLSGETLIDGTGTTPMPSTLSRSFSPARLGMGTDRELMVTLSGIGALDGFAQLVEMLPAGFTYNDGSAEVADATPHAKSGVLATVSGQVVTMEVVAADSVSYTVSVADNVGTGSYLFRGVVKTLTSEEQIDATVISPTATRVPAAVPTRQSSRRRGGGGGGGGGGYAPPVVTATPMPTRAPSAAVATIVPTPTPIIVPTIAAPTPEPTAAPTPEPTAVPPTAVPTPRPTARVVVPTVAPTKPPEPTAMPKPTAVPPTAAPPTEVPPTAMVEPTEPPAPTATIAPTVAPVTPVAPTDDGMPTWLIILIIVIVVAVVIAAVGFYMMRMRR